MLLRRRNNTNTSVNTPKGFVDVINDTTEENLTAIIACAETEKQDHLSQFEPTCTEIAKTLKRLAKDVYNHPWDCKCVLHR